MKELIRAAEGIGLRIHLTGELPKQEDIAYLAIVAIRECVTNAVRHARATEIYVEFQHTENSVLVMITNNGAKPERKIIEGGWTFFSSHKN